MPLAVTSSSSSLMFRHLCHAAIIIISFILLIALIGEILSTNHPKFSPSRSSPRSEISQPKISATEQTFPAGSVIIGMLRLQVNCLLQPPGSSVFEASYVTWRILPYYCLVDLIQILFDVARLSVRFRCSLSSTCLVMCASRYRSTLGISNEDLLGRSPEHKAMNDMRHVKSAVPNPTFASLALAVLAILQLLKITTAQGSPNYILFDHVVAIIFFSHWLVLEVLWIMVRLVPRDARRWDHDGIIQMAIHLRPMWTQEFSGCHVNWHGLHIFCSPLYLLVFPDNNNSEHGASAAATKLPNWALAYVFLSIVVLGIMCIATCVWSCVWGYDNSGKTQNCTLAAMAVHWIVWFLHVHIFVYDKNQTYREGWTDWLG